MSNEREGLRDKVGRLVYEACLAHEGDERYPDGPSATEVADRILALLDSGEREPWLGASEPCDACGAPAGVACPKPSDDCRAICSCPTCMEPEPTTGRDEAIRQINGDYDEPQETLYPCAHPGCTRVRTRAEGGDTFTVCDKHWGSPEPDARYVVVTEEDEAMLVTLAEHFDTKADNYERTGPVARWVEGFLSRVAPEPRVEPVSRTPIADALHEAYMAGFNDAGTEQDALDADAFTEAGVALSRMCARTIEPVGRALNDGGEG